MRSTGAYFADHDDPGLVEAVRAGRAQEFAWDDQSPPDPFAPRTRGCAVLDWDALARPAHRKALRWHRDLIAVRRDTPELLQGRRELCSAEVDENQRCLLLRCGSLLLPVDPGVDPAVVEADDRTGLGFNLRGGPRWDEAGPTALFRGGPASR
jgi:maltooligosyltrehalose trehalohydrolase